MSDKQQIVPKIVKGGFRATLALFISLLALVFSIMTYYRTENQEALTAKINALQQKLEKVKQNSSEKIDKIGAETYNALKKLGIEIKKD
jgi:uncharacterized protein YfkK (UPF0435 family)